jgi:hypothetical protein
MAQSRLGDRPDAGGRWEKRARPRSSVGFARLIRMLGKSADRPRRIDRFIDYFGEYRRAQPASS